jgi:hypothetical protein
MIARSATKQQLDASDLYAALLEEAKIRIASIDATISGRAGLPAPLVREYSYLQLRMLCELIALGCLTAHGEIKATQAAKLQKEYSADRIIKRLEELHPNFYPHAIHLTITPLPPPGHVHFDRLKSGFLTKAELITLYGKCGDHLHRGSLKRLLASARQTQPPNFADIAAWTNKIITLLNQHHIASFDNLSHFICMLNGGASVKNQASVAIALSPLPSTDGGATPR